MGFVSPLRLNSQDELLSRVSLDLSGLSKREAGDEKLQFYLGFIFGWSSGIYRLERQWHQRGRAYITVVPVPPEFREWQKTKEHTGGPIAIRVRKGITHSDGTLFSSIYNICIWESWHWNMKLFVLWQGGRSNDWDVQVDDYTIFIIRPDMQRDWSLRERRAVLSPWCGTRKSISRGPHGLRKLHLYIGLIILNDQYYSQHPNILSRNVGLNLAYSGIRLATIPRSSAAWSTSRSGDKWYKDSLIMGGFGRAGFFVYLLLLIIALSVWLCRKRDTNSSSAVPKVAVVTYTGTVPQGVVSRVGPLLQERDQSPNNEPHLQPVVLGRWFCCTHSTWWISEGGILHHWREHWH